MKKHPVSLSIILLLLLPAAGALSGYATGPFLARADKRVQLASQLHQENVNPASTRDVGVAALRAAGADLTILVAQAEEQTRRISRGAVLLGAFCGLALALHLISLLLPGRHEFFSAKAAECVACARCFRYCPMEQQRLKSDTRSCPPGPSL